jgi:hypothetical protein
MRLLATLMTSIMLLTTALFAHALVAADEPPAPAVEQVASR